MSTIRVTFVDAGRDAVLDTADLPPDHLPETFELETTMQLGGKEWTVESADPVTRVDFIASGTLRLVLREIQLVDPKTILFSLCTLENTQPPLVEGELEGAFRIHEDDWRQHEYLAARLETEIEAELVDIRDAQTSRKGPGFERLHVRSRIPAPFSGIELSMTALQAALGEPERRVLAIGDRVVDGGFAFSGDAVVYGHQRDGMVTALAVTGEIRALDDLAKSHSLVLVDWCAAQRGGTR